VERTSQGQPFRADTAGPAYAARAGAMSVAYPGEQMQTAGHGGSIPLCGTPASRYPEAEILLIGLSGPEAQIHAVNESVCPQGLARLSLTEALFLVNHAAAEAT
jgi:acetylornithine deacetylase/succinyl-diaminopimelate desuccinylase-like protein